MPFEFNIKEEISVSDILKIFNLKIDTEQCNNILEKLELIIELMSILKITRILVIPNLKTYLSDQELVELYKYSLYNNIELFLIENNSRKKLEYEKILSIDEYFNDEII